MSTDDIIHTETGLVFNPYNPLNVEITLSDVQSILAKYNLPIVVHNEKLYKRAFVHKSYLKRPLAENSSQNITIATMPENCLPLKTKSNERMEFLGDGVVELVTKYILYKRFPKENEGFMTEKKIAIVKNEAIGKIAYEMGLHKWLLLSKHAEEKKIRTNMKRLGCLFEAFVGAIFLDLNKIEVLDEHNWFSSVFTTGPGFQFAQKFIENVFEKHIDWVELVQNDDNYKNILQVKIQKEFKVTPHYMEVTTVDSEEGYNMGVYLCLGQSIHNLTHAHSIPFEDFKTFKNVHARLMENNAIFLFLGNGKHKIKRKAEQNACFNAIQIIEQYENEDNDIE
jgi:dsRNA-specific ribonuclease